MPDKTKTNEPKPGGRTVRELRRKLATKNKPFVGPAPIRETLQRALAATRDHLDAGRRNR